MSRPQLSQIRALSPADVYRWNVQFSGTGAAQLGILDNQANLRAVSTTLPKKVIEPLEMRVRGHHVVKPGVADEAGQITLNIYETEDNFVSNLLKNWTEMHWSTDIGVGQPLVTTDVIMTIQRLDRQDNAIYDYELYGCFVLDGDSGELTGEGGNPMQVAFNVQYSGFRQQPSLI